MANGLRPFALPHSHTARCFLCTDWRGVHKKHNTHRNMTTPSAVLGGLGRCYAELRLFGILGSWTSGVSGSRKST
jgi:hypothetical protein